MIDVYAIPAGLKGVEPQFEVVELQMDQAGLDFAIDALMMAASSYHALTVPAARPKTIQEALTLPEQLDEETVRALGKRVGETHDMERDLVEAAWDIEEEPGKFHHAVVRGPRVVGSYESIMFGTGALAARRSRGALFPERRRNGLLDAMLSSNFSNHLITLKEHRAQVSSGAPLGVVLIDSK